MTTTLLVGSTPDALATELIRRIGAIAEESVHARGVFNVAVSGGSMPKVRAEHGLSQQVSKQYNSVLVAAFACTHSLYLSPHDTLTASPCRKAWNIQQLLLLLLLPPCVVLLLMVLSPSSNS